MYHGLAKQARGNNSCETGERMKEYPKDTQLQNSDYWDWQSGKKLPPSKSTRSVISVAFNGSEFQAVGAAARKAGKFVSTFIKEAALEKAANAGFAAVEWTAGNRSWTDVHAPQAITQGPANAVVEPGTGSVSTG